jgi:hypothetical protein
MRRKKICEDFSNIIFCLNLISWVQLYAFHKKSSQKNPACKLLTTKQQQKLITVGSENTKFKQLCNFCPAQK